MVTILQMMMDLRNAVDSHIADVQKFEEKDNAAAGTRVTKGMMDVKKRAQAIREAVFDRKKPTATE